MTGISKGAGVESLLLSPALGTSGVHVQMPAANCRPFMRSQAEDFTKSVILYLYVCDWSEANTWDLQVSPGLGNIHFQCKIYLKEKILFSGISLNSGKDVVLCECPWEIHNKQFPCQGWPTAPVSAAIWIYLVSRSGFAGGHLLSLFVPLLLRLSFWHLMLSSAQHWGETKHRIF